MRHLLLWSLLVFALPASAQKPAGDLAADAVSHLLATLQEQTHYTFLDTEHDRSYIDGKFNEEKTILSETIELEGAPYERHLQINGKPLSGRALAHEQQAYEQAIRERRSVSDIRGQGHKTAQHSSKTVLDRLTIDFTNRIIGHESMDGHACVQLVFEPKPEVSPAQTKKFTLWVETTTHEVLRYDQELLVTENNLLAGSVFSWRFAPVDGVLLERQFISDISWNEPAIHNKLIHLIGTHDYTNYRRFRTTVTVSPASPDVQ